MSIRKDVTVKITNNNATLDMPLQIYELDHGIELRFKLMDYKYKYTKDPQNILNSSDEDILEAYTTIINPRGYELQQINGEVKDDIVVFMIDSSYTDEIDEVGIYSLQIHIKCACSEFSIPPIQFEVLQRLKGIKVVTDGEDSIDDSALIDNYSNFISDETGKLLIEWKKGDIISSVKLNAMVEVINNAVDEEVQRQLNEVKREQQELERQNKVRETLNSVDARVDESMNEFETRFNALTISKQQDMEVIDARDGEMSLKARLDRDVKNPLQVYEDVEGSYISCDSTEGYAQNVEILGNTIQNQNDLADIRSVGDKLENQELYEIPVLITGKNLFNKNDALKLGYYYSATGSIEGSGSLSDSNKNFISEKYFKITSDTITWSGIGGTAKHPLSLCFYDKDKNFINRYETTNIINYTVPSNAEYFRIKGDYNRIDYLQLELGAKTEYQEYKEQQITILSPVQLEKVGDVADRIVCKDGVWGVEKNINTVNFNTDLLNATYNISETQVQYYVNSVLTDAHVDNSKINNINSFCPSIATNDRNTNSEIACFNGTGFCFSMPKTLYPTIADFKNAIPEYIEVKYKLAQPTFIPLPYDQQIKLRTFANKTNISFGCEIEPTLKVSVSKTIGATVNSHTEQIDNLSKELEKINNLEESVASEVVTESDFSTVENTSNGYFEDVKLDGRTLVNLYENKQKEFHKYYIFTKDEKINLSLFKPNTVYTAIILDETDRINYTSLSDNSGTIGIYMKVYDKIFTFKTPSDFSNLSSVEIRMYAYSLRDANDFIKGDENKIKIMILEGDHTQNPPEYFEGIKSVGQDVDEISVETRSKNLLEIEHEGKYRDYTSGVLQLNINFNSCIAKVMPNTRYRISANGNTKARISNLCFFDSDFNFIEGIPTDVLDFVTPSNCAYLTVAVHKDLKNVQIEKGDNVTCYVPPKSHSKVLLYYNDETQTWEKPVLRQWDSIEKHSNGKYYYHKRSGEVVLNGSEDWTYHKNSEWIYGIFKLEEFFKENNISSATTTTEIPNLINDKFKLTSMYHMVYEEINSITSWDSYEIAINTGLKITNVEAINQGCINNFKQWLQANPTTVVYKLAEEKVYECTDLDLITYQNEINLMVKGGVIVPKTTLKVHQNITNITTILQEKVNILENNVGHVTEIFVNSKIEPINNEIGNINTEIDNINTDLFGISESIEGSSVSVVSKDGYLKDIEIIGNTIQNQNDLADIRSVGDKVEGQELYEIPVLSSSSNKNLFRTKEFELGNISSANGDNLYSNTMIRSGFIPIKDTTYITSIDGVITLFNRVYYDKDKNFLGYGLNENPFNPIKQQPNAKYIRFTKTVTDVNAKYQFEEGTQATPYEPYREDKLTILSPTPLEKVGDVADRIICKDGIWGVEKNIETVTFNGSENWRKNIGADTHYRFTMDFIYEGGTSNLICDRFPTKGDTVTENTIFVYNGSIIVIGISKDIITEYDVDKFKAWLQTNPTTVLYQSPQPQFIPLPYDQQVKLRTFANKTNISFGCEIEPTLKASIPKSLSATVNTHSEQIDNLGKELDRVKKLEESTVSTVTTESDFTTVTETSNGYFEDVKLKGRTLVNLIDNTNVHSSTGMVWTAILNAYKNKKVTVFVRVVNEDTTNMKVAIYRHKSNGASAGWFMQYNASYVNKPFVADFSTDSATDFADYVVYIHNHDGKSYLPFNNDNIKIMVLEGDHTQNPPKYFEGIKSVGQDADEISVLSCNENLFDKENMYIINKDVANVNRYFSENKDVFSYIQSANTVILYDEFNANTPYSIKITCRNKKSNIHVGLKYSDGTSEYPKIMSASNDFKSVWITSDSTKTLKGIYSAHVDSSEVEIDLDDVVIVKGNIQKDITHKQDKKRILYYNPTTETWDKPVLKEWDSIEKHSDGKYYYHKRSEEVILNSSDDWKIRTDVTDDGVHIMFSLITSCEYNKSSYMICNRYKPMPFVSAAQAYGNGEGFAYYATNADSRHIFYYVLPKSKLSSQDEAGFKAWLQANPTTIVYQLETEEVYECTSIDLMSYENETNYIVTAGAIAPISTLKVMCNINNVVRELQQKVSNLENYIQHVMIDALNNALNE